jgi:RNA polymerase sigma factor (sigma-70 family)
MVEMQDKSDAQLLRDYAESGHEVAFREIVTRHTDFVYSAALRQVDSPDLACDLTQGVFTDLAGKARPLAEKLVEGSSLVGWLYRSTRFAALKHLRDDRRRLAHERQAMEQLITNSETAPDWEQVRPVLDETMADLNEEDREALLLRFFKNCDFHAVGQALGVSDAAAQKRVSRALDKLRDLLSRRGITTSAGALSIILSANAVQAAPVGLAVTISAAAALGGTTLVASATATAIKTIAMTTLQKTIITTTVAVLAGAGIYEARQASHLREQNQALQQQQAPLTGQIEQLQRERDDATSRLTSLADQSATLNKTPTELLKLRGEVARLRADSNDPTGIAAKALTAKVERLKQRMQDTPNARIPELQLLTEEDWISIANRKLDTDDDYRQALAGLRQVADGKWGATLQLALSRFGKANGGQFPTDLAQLKTYFDSPVDDAMLQRWQIVAANTVSKRVDGGNWVITQKAAVDAESDRRFVLGLYGFNSTGFFPSSGWLGDTLDTLREAYSAANKGQESTEISQLLPYATTPEKKAALEIILKKSGAK